ncbi:hypothetical protein MMC30_007789 [Trapelia coarctata]|nr:hypothetical protein [Trapelia coarctata]
MTQSAGEITVAISVARVVRGVPRLGHDGSQRSGDAVKGNGYGRRAEQHDFQLVRDLGVRSQVLQAAVDASFGILNLVKLIDQYKAQTNSPVGLQVGISYLAGSCELVPVSEQAASDIAEARRIAADDEDSVALSQPAYPFVVAAIAESDVLEVLPDVLLPVGRLLALGEVLEGHVANRLAKTCLYMRNPDDPVFAYP